MPSIRSSLAASALFLSLLAPADALVARAAKGVHYKAAVASVSALPQWIKEILIKDEILSGDILDKRQQAGAFCAGDNLYTDFGSQPGATAYCSSKLRIPMVTVTSTVVTGYVELNSKFFNYNG